jgi:hypothetical protein
MADLRIDLAAEFKGKKAFKEADQAVGGLDKAVGKLGKQVASVFAAQKIIAFGKASVKAFAEDQASAARLTKTVNNLGLAFANPAITQFIQKLSMQSGIVDETLRPAFQGLLTTTGDVTKSMGLLTKAVDISRGSGVDLATVTQDLNNGYVGITRGLKKYNLGLSQAQLKAMSFEQIMVLLNKQFNGASAAYLETYAGKMDILNTAADNAKETIGKGLVDALTLAVGSNGDVKTLAGYMQDIADESANAAVGIGYLVSGLDSMKSAIPGLSKLLSLGVLGKYGPFGLLADIGKKVKAQNASGYGDYSGSTVDYQRQQDQKAAARAKAIADKKARDLAAQTLKNQQKLTAEQKKQAQLKKDGTVFDMQQIELIAALKGQLSKDDEARVKLQLALLDGNVEEADRLTKQILMAQDSTGNLYKYFLSIGDMTIKNPFAFLDTWLAEFQKKLAATLAMTNTATATTATAAYVPAGMSSAIAALGVTAGYGANIPQTGTPSTIASTTLANGSFGIQTGVGNFVDSSSITGSGTNVKVYVQGNVVTEQDLIDAIQRGLQTNSLSGSPSSIGRIAGMFG